MLVVATQLAESIELDNSAMNSFFILTLSERSFTGLLPLTLHHGPPHELLSQVKLEAEAIIQLFVERHEHQKLSLVGLEILFEKNKVC